MYYATGSIINAISMLFNINYSLLQMALIIQ